MKRKIIISGSVSGTIATGSFQNLKPSFTWEEEYEIGENELALTDNHIQARRKELYEMSFSLLKEAENKALIERIERERADLRFVASPTTGKMLPSVTSIRDYDADFFVSAEELRQYASQSNIVHAKVAEYIKTGKWADVKALSDIWSDILIVTKGSLKLPIETGDFPGFLKKYPIENMVNGMRGFDDKHEYCGEPDFFGIPQFKEAKQIMSTLDVKRTPSKVKDGIQLAAYCKLSDTKQGIVVPLNDKTVAQFSKPILYNEKELEGYFKMFLQKRKEFKKRYGI